MNAKRQLPSAPPTGDYREDHWPEGLRHYPSGYYWQRQWRTKRRKKALGKDLDVAIAEAKKFNRMLDADVDPGIQTRQAAVSFDAFAAQFLNEKSGVIRERSANRYATICSHFQQYLDRHQPNVRSMADITEGVAVAYKAHRRCVEISPNGNEACAEKKTGVKPKTLWAELNLLRSIFASAVTRGVVKANPFADVKINRREFKKTRPHRVLDEAEMSKLLKAAEKHDKWTLSIGGDAASACLHDVFYTFLKTGLRHDELVHLEWTDLDVEHGFIQVHSKQVHEVRRSRMLDDEVAIWRKLLADKEDDDKVFRRVEQIEEVRSRLRIRAIDDLLSLRARDVDLEGQTISLDKTFEWKPKASEGKVPVSPKLRDLLSKRRARLQNMSNFVFPAPDGGKCRLHLLDQLHVVCREAGIDKPLPRVHDLRHSFACWLRGNHVPLETIMGMMRHSDIRETLLYAPYHAEEGRAAVLKLDTNF